MGKQHPAAEHGPAEAPGAVRRKPASTAPPRIRTPEEIRANPHLCALCGGWSRETTLRFNHAREGRLLQLEMNLCSACGDRIEKHLKRAIPLRSMELLPVG